MRSETLEVVVVDAVQVVEGVAAIVAVTLPVLVLLILPHTPVLVAIGVTVISDSATTLMDTTILMLTMELEGLKQPAIRKIQSVSLTTQDVTVIPEFLLVVSWVVSCFLYFLSFFAVAALRHVVEHVQRCLEGHVAVSAALIKLKQ